MKWQKVKLGEVCEIISGSTPRTGVEDLWDGEIAWATPRDLSKLDSVYIEKTAQRITEKGFKSCSTQMLPIGSVLLSSRAPIGHVAINAIPICTNQGFKSLIPNEGLHNKFLYYWLRANREFLDSLGNGATFKEVSKAIVERVEIPLPPLDEQKRIASILDAADALRRVRRQSLARLDELAQSLFLELFGDGKQFPLEKFGDLVSSTKIGLVRSSNEVGPELPTPYIRMNAITRSGELNLTDVYKTKVSDVEAKDYSLESGDFLFNTRNSRELVGKTTLFRGSGHYVFNNNILRARFREDVNSEYIAGAFRTPKIQQELESRKSGTTNVFAIYYKDLSTVPIPLPPLSLQQTFAGQIEELERIKARGRAQLGELDALFASLQERAFDGRL